MGALPDGPVSTMAGPYRIVRRLGSGGMGVVYLATEEGTGHRVAVKLIRPEYAADPHFRARLRQEVTAARRVPRFCTAPVVGADLSADPPWVATEYIDGPTLDVLLLEQGPLADSRLEAFAVGVAVALRAVHGHGVVHRDLKPSNVLLSSMGPRVIDFGIARVEEDTRLTRTGAVVGTPAYMAPEQLSGQPLTAAVDIFAWGALVAYAATGRPPFGSGQPAMYAILHEEPDLPDLPESLRELVRAALAKQPADRPSAVELVERLSRGAAEATTQVLAAATAAPAPEAVPAPAAPPTEPALPTEPAPPTELGPVPEPAPPTELAPPTEPAVPPARAGAPAVAPPRTPRPGLVAVGVTAPVVVVVAAAIIAWQATATPHFTTVVAELSTGHTRWMLLAAGLVLLVAPGQALLHSGGSRRHSGGLRPSLCYYFGVGLAGLLWLGFGFTFAYGWDSVQGLFSLDFSSVYFGSEDGLRKEVRRLFTAGMAGAAVALVATAVAGRVRGWFWLGFVLLWSTLVVFPVAHWVGHEDGWLRALGAAGAPGGYEVHVAGGAAALALGLVLRHRSGGTPDPPRRPALTLAGAGLLAAGWTGLMVGWYLAARGPIRWVPGEVLLDAGLAAASAALAWWLSGWRRSGQLTARDIGHGPLAGLVAITPAVGNVTPVGALLIGALAGVACAAAVRWRPGVLGPAHESVGLYLVAAAIGASLSGPGPAVESLLTSGGLRLASAQLLAVVTVGGYSFAVAWLIGWVGLRSRPEQAAPTPPAPGPTPLPAPTPERRLPG